MNNIRKYIEILSIPVSFPLTLIMILMLIIINVLVVSIFMLVIALGFSAFILFINIIFKMIVGAMSIPKAVFQLGLIVVFFWLIIYVFRKSLIIFSKYMKTINRFINIILGKKLKNKIKEAIY